MHNDTTPKKEVRGQWRSKVKKRQSTLPSILVCGPSWANGSVVSDYGTIIRSLPPCYQLPVLGELTAIAKELSTQFEFSLMKPICIKINISRRMEPHVSWREQAPTRGTYHVPPIQGYLSAPSRLTQFRMVVFLKADLCAAPLKIIRDTSDLTLLIQRTTQRYSTGWCCVQPVCRGHAARMIASLDMHWLCWHIWR